MPGTFFFGIEQGESQVAAVDHFDFGIGAGEQTRLCRSRELTSDIQA